MIYFYNVLDDQFEGERYSITKNIKYLLEYRTPQRYKEEFHSNIGDKTQTLRH